MKIVYYLSYALIVNLIAGSALAYPNVSFGTTLIEHTTETKPTAKPKSQDFSSFITSFSVTPVLDTGVQYSRNRLSLILDYRLKGGNDKMWKDNNVSFLSLRAERGNLGNSRSIKLASVNFIAKTDVGRNFKDKDVSNSCTDYPYTTEMAVANCASVSICRDGHLQKLKCTSCKNNMTLGSDGRCKCDQSIYKYSITGSVTGGESCTYGFDEDNKCQEVDSSGALKTYYAGCLCPTDWSECTGTGQVGVGTPCVEKGKTKYAHCSCQSPYTYLCTGEGVTYTEKGSGSYCQNTLTGFRYYTTCAEVCKTGFYKGAEDFWSTCGKQACQNQHSLRFVVTSSSANQSITLSIAGSANIDWGDGSIETDTSGTKAHSYASAGSYRVEITGTPTQIENIRTGDSIHVSELLSIDLPGVTSYNKLFYNQRTMTGDLSNMSFPSSLVKGDYMFYGCSGLTGNIPTLPSGLTSGTSMFYNCTGLTGFGFSAFPSSLTKGSYMFEGCTGLTGNIPALPSSLVNGDHMFNKCTGLTGNIPTLPSSLTSGSYMFNNCTGLTGNIPALPSSLTDGSNMFYRCTGLTGNIPALPSSLVNGNYMFRGCTGLTGNIPALPSSMTNGGRMFYGCTGLTGQCPIKPDSLTSYTNMFADSGISCSYGK